MAGTYEGHAWNEPQGIDRLRGLAADPPAPQPPGPLPDPFSGVNGYLQCIRAHNRAHVDAELIQDREELWADEPHPLQPWMVGLPEELPDEEDFLADELRALLPDKDKGHDPDGYHPDAFMVPSDIHEQCPHVPKRQALDPLENCGGPVPKRPRWRKGALNPLQNCEGLDKGKGKDNCFSVSMS